MGKVIGELLKLLSLYLVSSSINGKQVSEINSQKPLGDLFKQVSIDTKLNNMLIQYNKKCHR